MLLTGFEHLRVLDLGWVWAGGVMGQVFADMGAEVIKVETRKRIDPARQGRPIIGDIPDPEQNPLFHNVNRGKKSITVNITHPKGRELLLQLVKLSDIVVENMSPHALAAARLNYANMNKVNPQVIMVSYPLAGQTGPFNELRGYGNAGGALVGLDSLGADPDDDEFCGFNHVLGDPAAGQYAVIAVLAALRHRNLTGEGQYIDLSMVESVGTMVGEGIMDYVMNDRIPQARGNHHPFLAPHGTYPCDGDDKWVSIAVETDTEWRSLCQIMERSDMADDPRFADFLGRTRHRRLIDETISSWTRPLTQYQVMQDLQACEIAAMPCFDQEGRYFDPHLQERQCHIDVDHPILGTEPLYGIPYKLSETPGQVRLRAPLLGEHNAEVFGELLGLSEEEHHRLVTEEALF